MKLPRMKLSSLCVVIGLVAVNLAWLRFLIASHKSLLGLGDGDFGVLDLGVLGMLDILVLAFYGLRRGPFRFGFVIGGVVAVLASVCLCGLAPSAFARHVVMEGAVYPMDRWITDHGPSLDPRKSFFAIFAINAIGYSAVLAGPMVLFASVCGVATRFIVRRARATPSPSSNAG